MTTQTVEAIVEDYLGRLRAAAWTLSPDRQGELVDGIREHIVEARAAGANDEAQIRSLLDRLGTPEEIAGAAARESGVDTPSPYPVLVARRSLAHEAWAVILLTVGGLVIPLFGWVVGVVLLWTSDRWNIREKVLGTLVLPGGMGSIILLSFGMGVSHSTTFTSCSFSSSNNGATPTPASCTTTGTAPVHSTTAFLPLVLAGLGLLLPPLIGIFLYRRARRRADATRPYLMPVENAVSSRSNWRRRARRAGIAMITAGLLVPVVLFPAIAAKPLNFHDLRRPAPQSPIRHALGTIAIASIILGALLLLTPTIHRWARNRREA